MVHLVPPASMALEGAGSDLTPSPTAPTSEPNFAPRFDTLSVDELTCPVESSGVEKSELVSPPQDVVTENVATQAAESRVPQTAPGTMRWGTHQVPVVWVAVAGAGLLLSGGVATALWMQVGHEDATATSLAGHAVPEAKTVPKPDLPSVANVQDDVALDTPPGQPTDLESIPQTASRSATTTLPEEVPTAELIKPSPGKTRRENLSRNDPEFSEVVSPVVAERSLTTQGNPPTAAVSGGKAATETTAMQIRGGLASGSDSVDTEKVAAGKTKQPVASFEPIPKQTVSPDQPPSIGASEPLANDQVTAIEPPGLPIGGDLLQDRGPDGLPAVRRGPVDHQPGHGRDLSVQLAIPIASTEILAMPLAGWLDFVSDLMAVPITLDPNALLVAGLAADRPITISTGDTTSGELLEQALVKYRLHFVEKSGQLSVISQESERPRTSSYDVKELLSSGTTDATSIAAWVRQLVAPNSWSRQGGTGSIQVQGSKLKVEHQHGVQVQVLVLLERMLLARGLPNKSRYPIDRLSIEPTYLVLQPKLEQARTVNFLPWAELRNVLRYVQQAWDVTVIVDWQSLADVQLEPTSLVACSVGEQTWDGFFQQVLEPLGLTWRPLDEETLQITSQATARMARWIEFYPVNDLVRERYSDTNSLVEAIAGDLDEAEMAKCEFVYDSGSEHLLVLANAAAHHALTVRLAAL